MARTTNEPAPKAALSPEEINRTTYDVISMRSSSLTIRSYIEFARGVEKKAQEVIQAAGAEKPRRVLKAGLEKATGLPPGSIDKIKVSEVTLVRGNGQAETYFELSAFAKNSANVLNIEFKPIDSPRIEDLVDKVLKVELGAELCGEGTHYDKRKKEYVCDPSYEAFQSKYRDRAVWFTDKHRSDFVLMGSDPTQSMLQKQRNEALVKDLALAYGFDGKPVSINYYQTRRLTHITLFKGKKEQVYHWIEWTPDGPITEFNVLGR